MIQQQQEWNVTTIGYNARGAANALDTLMQEERVLLIDTRLSPKSVRHEWRKEALEAKYGSRYHWGGKYLGNVNFKGGEIKIADPTTGLRGLRKYLSEGYRLVLVCACPAYEQCHRRAIVELLCASTPGVRVMQPELPSEGGNAYMQREWTPQEGKIPCISIQQPMTEAIMLGRKSIELRTWGTSYRGIIAIHAGSKWYGGLKLPGKVSETDLAPIKRYAQRLKLPARIEDYPTGAIVGLARLVQCRRFSSASDYEYLREQHKGSEEWDRRDYGWWFTDVVRLPEPIKARGYLGLFGVDRGPMESVLQQFGEA